MSTKNAIQALGDYVLQDQILVDSMGTLWKAQKIKSISESGEVVTEDGYFWVKSLKIEYALDAAYRRKFIDELKLTKKNPIKGSLKVMDAVITANKLAVVYECPTGIPLDQEFQRDGMSMYEVVQIMLPVAKALDHYHALGIVHGDINLMTITVRANGSGVIRDMGIHKQAQWILGDGDLPFLPPERIRRKQVLYQGDCFSFGMIIFHLLTGRFPWDAKLKEEAVLPLKEQNRLLPISTFMARVDVELQACLMQFLLAEPTSRPRKCMKLMEVLGDALVREEQTAEIPIIDPKVLERAKKQVAKLDDELALIARKIAAKEAKLAEAKHNWKTTKDRAEKKYEEAMSVWNVKMEESKTSLNSMQEDVDSAWSKLTHFFSKSKQKEQNQILQKAQQEYDHLQDEYNVNRQKSEDKFAETIEKADQLLQNMQRKVLKDVRPLRLEQSKLDEKLLALGEIHPKLLGFRAKKPFSRADVILGKSEIEMILLPKGSFMMGANPNSRFADEDELPSHKVSFKKGFWISTIPVTQNFYHAVTGQNPSQNKGTDNPVDSVTWFDAIRFCNTLSMREDLTPAYEIDVDDEAEIRWGKASNGYRLLTEAEWEFAARANRKYVFSGGDDPDLIGWYQDNTDETTKPVGQKEPNVWGLYDMSGNVWEWCWDWKGEYNDRSAMDPIGVPEGLGRIFRGGSYLNAPTFMRVSYRGGERPGNHLPNLGFRIGRFAK